MRKRWLVRIRDVEGTTVREDEFWLRRSAQRQAGRDEQNAARFGARARLITGNLDLPDLYTATVLRRGS